MKTREQVKDEVAKDSGYLNFDHFDKESKNWYYDENTPAIIDDIAKRYATECVKASLAKAAENADMVEDRRYCKINCGATYCNDVCEKRHIKRLFVDKASIDNENNIVIL